MSNHGNDAAVARPVFVYSRLVWDALQTPRRETREFRSASDDQSLGVTVSGFGVLLNMVYVVRVQKESISYVSEA